MATALWPESSTGSAAALRQALWLVRQALAAAGVDPNDLLDVEGDTLGLRPDADLRLDVTRFERWAAPGRHHDPEAAVRIYRGDLAEGLAHECFATERERLSDAFEDALALVARARVAAGDFAGARAAAERLVARDPLREEGHAVLIEVHAATGTRSQVVRQYRRLRAVLRRELDVDPLPETDAVYRRALGQTVEASRRRITAAFLRDPERAGLIARD